MAVRTAYQFIAAAQLVDNLRGHTTIFPAKESQARPLTPLTPAQQREVWEIVLKTAPGGKVTARHVEEVVRMYLGDEAPKASSRTSRGKKRASDGAGTAAEALTPAERRLLDLAKKHADVWDRLCIEPSPALEEGSERGGMCPRPTGDFLLCGPSGARP